MSTAVKVTYVSTHGIWLRVRDREHFMHSADFPWLKEQPVKTIVNVVEKSPNHFYWPDLDVDLTDEIIEHPKRFPNIAKHM